MTLDQEFETDVLGMRWEEAVARLHRAGGRVVRLEVTDPPPEMRHHAGMWRVVRQREEASHCFSLTLTRESGYRGRPLSVG